MPFFGPSSVPTAPQTGWIRPSDWLALPALATTDNRFVGLFAVTNDSSNLVALSATGAFTVDWGDGSAPVNYASGAIASYKYNYANVGNLSTLGYKQVIISVTPQLGQTFTSLNLQKLPTGYITASSIPWLDIAIAGTALTSFVVSTNPIVVTLGLLRQCTVISLAPTYNAFVTMFYKCANLGNVKLPFSSTAAGTNFNSMFYSCSSLTTVPLFNTAAGTNFSSMFVNCSSLTTVPLFNTAAGTNFSSMFVSCYSLTTVPAFNVSNAIAASSLTDFITNTIALSSFNATGASQSISFAASPKLAYPQLQAILANLGTAVAGSIVNISGTYGQPSITAADRLVATNKGWTVTG